MNDLLPEVAAFLADTPKKFCIGGRWVEAADGATFDTLDPGNGTVLATVSAGGPNDIDRAVQAGDDAFRRSGWATMPVAERSAILRRLADLIVERQEIIGQIESLDVGKPRAQATGFDVPFAAEAFRYYAGLAEETQRRVVLQVAGYEAHSALMPYGVCGFIFPWNFPFLLVGWGIAPALAAGNTVVIKPAEDTPLSTLYFAKLVEEAGIPAGVVNVVTGMGESAGAALAAHPGLKRMSFTGSPEIGRLIAESCGRNLTPVKLELGGKGAAVVFEDVEVETVAQSLAEAVTLNAGQVCCTATRWLLHESIHDAFIEQAREVMASMQIGYGGDPETELGPVVSDKQRRRVLGYLERGLSEGAQSVLTGGKADVSGRPEGFYVKPALLEGAPDNVCARDEIFGPVAYIILFRNEEEAIDLVHRSAYGLANSVWSEDLERARRVGESLVAGNTWINTHNLFAYGIPYGGCNLSGCGGGVLGPDTFRDYLRSQSIARPVA